MHPVIKFTIIGAMLALLSGCAAYVEPYPDTTYYYNEPYAGTPVYTSGYTYWGPRTYYRRDRYYDWHEWRRHDHGDRRGYRHYRR
jgi:hypothetical protein